MKNLLIFAGCLVFYLAASFFLVGSNIGEVLRLAVWGTVIFAAAAVMSEYFSSDDPSQFDWKYTGLWAVFFAPVLTGANYTVTGSWAESVLFTVQLLILGVVVSYGSWRLQRWWKS